jgi:MFS family permease
MSTQVVDVTEFETRVPAQKSAFAVAALFFVNGLVFSNFFPRIPEVRDRLGVDNGGLGASLLGAGLGGLIGSFLVSRTLQRFGTKKTVLVSATTLSFLLPLFAVVPSPVTLALLLLTLGFLDVNADMAMNSQGAFVQDRLGRSIMQRLHGGWSLGFVCGSIVGSLAARFDVPMGLHFSAIALILLATLFTIRNMLLPVDPVIPVAAVQGNKNKFSLLGLPIRLLGWRRAPTVRVTKSARRQTMQVLAMGAMAITAAWLEATPNDWSALTMTDVFNAKDWAGAGTVAFAAAMLLGRLNGDFVLERIGAKRMLDGALVVALIGAIVVVVSPNAISALIGFFIWGLGVSVVFPQLYLMAATLPGAQGAGLGAMGVGQRFGFLAAPLIVGSLSKATSLKTAIAVISTAALVIGFATKSLVNANAK